ncbi:MAG: hypothetical protein QM479_11675 [Pseudomonadota bacterium]
MKAIIKLSIWLVLVLLIALVTYFALKLFDGDSVNNLSTTQREVSSQPGNKYKQPQITQPLLINTLHKEQNNKPISTQSHTAKQPILHPLSEKLPSKSATNNAPLTEPKVRPINTSQINPSRRQKNLQKINHLKRIQSELYTLLQGDPAKIDIQKLDKILEQLSTMADKQGVLSGININQLRSNLKTSAKMVSIAKKIEQHVTSNKAIDSKKLQNYSQQLHNLQRQLLVPITVKPIIAK